MREVAFEPTVEKTTETPKSLIDKFWDRIEAKADVPMTKDFLVLKEAAEFWDSLVIDDDIMHFERDEIGDFDSNRELVNYPPNTNEISSRQKDVNDGYYSTLEERIMQTPKENSDRGEWTDGRGVSEFIPYDEEIKALLSENGRETVKYGNDGIPDFSPFAKATVMIENMTADRFKNFKQCDEKCVEQWNNEGKDGKTDWTARKIKEWRQEKDYTWHEKNDTKTCELIPRKINDYFGHLGGVSECKKRDSRELGGPNFDK